MFTYASPDTPDCDAIADTDDIYFSLKVLVLVYVIFCDTFGKVFFIIYILTMNSIFLLLLKKNKPGKKTIINKRERNPYVWMILVSRLVYRGDVCVMSCVVSCVRVELLCVVVFPLFFKYIFLSESFLIS